MVNLMERMPPEQAEIQERRSRLPAARSAAALRHPDELNHT